MDFATRGLLAPTIFICCVLLAFISAAIFTCLLEDALDGCTLKFIRVKIYLSKQT
jgi:hypothetical protein